MNKSIIYAIIAGIVGLSIVGYVLTLDNTPEPQIAPIPDVVEIGVMLPFSGSFSAHGPGSHLAAELAADELNAYLNSLGAGWTVNLVAEDTETDPEVALEKIQYLDSRGAKLILGTETSAALQSVKSYADSNDMFLISPSSSSPTLSIDDNIFRLIPDDTHQGLVLSELFQNDGIKVVIPVYLGDVWGDGLYVSTADFFEESGGIVDHGVRYSPDTVSLSSEAGELSEILNKYVDEGYAYDDIAILSIGFSEVVSLFNFASSYDELKNVKWYGSDASSNDAGLIEDPVSLQFASDVGLVTTQFAVPSNAKTDRIIDHVVTMSGSPPTAYAYSAYDGIWLFGLSILEAQSLNASDIKAVLPGVASDYDGAIGDITFNEFGDLDLDNYDLWTIQNNEWVLHGVYLADSNSFEFSAMMDDTMMEEDAMMDDTMMDDTMMDDTMMDDTMMDDTMMDDTMMDDTMMDDTMMDDTMMDDTMMDDTMMDDTMMDDTMMDDTMMDDTMMDDTMMDDTMMDDTMMDDTMMDDTMMDDTMMDDTMMDDTMMDSHDIEHDPVSIVNDAISQYDEIGELLFDEINSEDNPYGEQYLFVVSADDNTIIAHGANSTRVGDYVDVFNEADRPLEEILSDLEVEGTWITYTFLNPTTEMDQSKKSWLVLHDNLIFGSGIYFTDSMKSDTEHDPVSIVSDAISKYNEIGDSLFDEITFGGNPYGEQYLFVVNATDNIAIAHGNDPNIVGDYATPFTEADRPLDEIMTDLEVEGTWITYTFAHPTTGLDQSKKSWLVLHDNLIFGSGIYLTDNMESDTMESDTMESDTMESDTMESDTMESDTMESDTEHDPVSIVNNALSQYEEIGDLLFDKINSGDNLYGEQYLFVVSADDNTIIAHGADSNRVGDYVDAFDEADRPLDEILTDLQFEGTWITYTFPHPTTGLDQPKKSWLVLHDDLIFGSGIYLN